MRGVPLSGAEFPRAVRSSFLHLGHLLRRRGHAGLVAVGVRPGWRPPLSEVVERAVVRSGWRLSGFTLLTDHLHPPSLDPVVPGASRRIGGLKIEATPHPSSPGRNRGNASAG